MLREPHAGSGSYDPAPLLGTPDMVSATQDFLTFFSYAILGALAIGLIVAAAAYLVRPLVGKVSQFWTLRGWADKRLKKAASGGGVPQWLSDAVKGDENSQTLLKERVGKDFGAIGQRVDHGLEAALTSIPEARFWSTALADELFMHSVQAVAKAAVARPLQHPELFLVVTADAPPDARSVAYAFAALAERDPAAASRLADFDKSTNTVAAALASTENIITASAESALDQLQLSLMKKGVWLNRGLCVATGVALASAAVSVLKSPHPTVFYAIGAAGGVVALVIDDTATYFFRRFAK
jgi:hypothetical protein